MSGKNQDLCAVAFAVRVILCLAVIFRLGKAFRHHAVRTDCIAINRRTYRHLTIRQEVIELSVNCLQSFLHHAALQIIFIRTDRHKPVLTHTVLIKIVFLSTNCLPSGRFFAGYVIIVFSIGLDPALCHTHLCTGRIYNITVRRDTALQHLSVTAKVILFADPAIFLHDTVCTEEIPVLAERLPAGNCPSTNTQLC